MTTPAAQSPVHTTNLRPEPWWLSSWFLGLLAGVLIVSSALWFGLTFIPVAVIEVQYQTRQVMTNVFGATNLRQVFFPNMKGFLDLRGQSKHQDFGITIPTLQIDEPVIFNVDPNDEKAYNAALKKGIAHASGTAFPDNPGLGYYFAHSSNPSLRFQYNAIFYLLGKLEAEDEIFIWHDQQRFEYRVTERKITSPQDVSFLNTTYDQETIVLQTCWPPGTTNQRLLVFAERVK